MFTRIARPVNLIVGFVAIAAAIIGTIVTYAPEAHAAPVYTTSIVQKTSTDNYEYVEYRVVATYRKNVRPAKLRFINTNDFEVKIEFYNQNYKLFKTKIIPANSSRTTKLKTAEVVYSVAVVVDGTLTRLQGGPVNLSAR